MALTSRMFSGNERLAACQVNDPAHVVPGDSGPHVRLIQNALVIIDDLEISDDELAAQSYGPSTAAAVLAYKQARGIINPAIQTSPDNIVGKRTITSLDDDMLALQREPTARTPKFCSRLTVPTQEKPEVIPPRGVTLAFAGFSPGTRKA